MYSWSPLCMCSLLSNNILPIRLVVETPCVPFALIVPLSTLYQVVSICSISSHGYVISMHTVVTVMPTITIIMHNVSCDTSYLFRVSKVVTYGAPSTTSSTHLMALTILYLSSWLNICVDTHNQIVSHSFGL